MNHWVDRNMELFRELVSCGQNLYTWSYDDQMRALSSNCPDRKTLNMILSLDSHFTRIIELAHTGDMPLVITNAMELVWIAGFEKADDALSRIHVIGPAFTNDIPAKNVEDALARLELSAALKDEFWRVIRQIPVVSVIRLFEYGLMLHFCLTGAKITTSDLRYLDDGQEHPPNAPMTNQHGTWAAEQEMVRFVEEGNIQCKERMGRLVTTGNIGKLASGDSTRQNKNAVIVFITLCSRAAVRGGLAPEISYALSDRYIQGVENSATISALAEVSHTMHEDYIKRVHQRKLGSGISAEIQKCRNYIQLHTEESVSIHALAEMTGYTDYYLSKKFKRETGMTIQDYTLKAKIDRACDLLVSGRESIHEISALLGFSSQSYFGEQFRKSTGMTPGEYRRHMCST